MLGHLFPAEAKRRLRLLDVGIECCREPFTLVPFRTMHDAVAAATDTLILLLPKRAVQGPKLALLCSNARNRKIGVRKTDRRVY